MNHQFNIQDAEKYGVECAVLLSSIRYWILKNESNEKHFYDNRYWTYNSARAFSKMFPYWSTSQISRLLVKLQDAGILLVGNYNSSSYDRTKWFSLNEDVHLTKSLNGINEVVNSDTDINTDIEDKTDEKPRDSAKALVVKKIQTPEIQKPEDVSKEVWEDWIKLRKSKRATVTNLVIQGMKREAKKADYALENAMIICIERGWAAFRADWVIDKKPQSFEERKIAENEQKFRDLMKSAI